MLRPRRSIPHQKSRNRLFLGSARYPVANSSLRSRRATEPSHIPENNCDNVSTAFSYIIALSPQGHFYLYAAVDDFAHFIVLGGFGLYYTTRTEHKLGMLLQIVNAHLVLRQLGGCLLVF